MIRITVVAGKETTTYDYDGDKELKVGRLAENDLAIAHSDVSRTHFSIVPLAEGGFKVRDHASRNGILVNGTRTAESPLKWGDEIAIGPEVVLYFGGDPKKSKGKPVAARADGPPSAPSVPIRSKEDSDEEERRERESRPLPKGDGGPKGERSGKALEKAEAAGTVLASPSAGEGPQKEAAPTSPESELKGADAARTAAPRPARRRRVAPSAQSAATVFGIVLFLCGIGYGAYVFVFAGAESPHAHPGATTGAGAPPFRSAPIPELAIPQGAGGPLSKRRDTEDGREWERLQTTDLDGELLMGALEAFTRKYPNSPHAPEARRRLQSLRRIKEGGPAPGGDGGGKASPALEAEVLAALRAEAFGEAAYLAEVAPRLGVSGEKACEKLRKNVEKAAYEKFQEARERGRALAKEGRPLEAYDFVARIGLPLRRLPFFPEVEAELSALKRSAAMRADAVVTSAPSAAKDIDLSRRDRLLAEARRALATADYDQALERYRQIMGLPLAAEERVEFQWKIFDVLRARGLRQRLLERLASADKKGPPILVTLTQSIKAEVVDADASGVKMRAIFKDERERPIIEKRWKDLPPIQLLEMYRGLDLDGEGLLSLAALGFELDYEADAHAALVRIFEPPGWPAFRAEAAALLARKTGVSCPPEELVVFEERVIPTAEREKILAQRAAAAEEARRVAEEIKAAKREDKLAAAFDLAGRQMEAGQFVEARDLLRQIAALEKKFPESEVVKKARARYEDPLMRRRALEIQGRDENRVSISFLAEGYTCEKNADQQAFDRTAEQCLKYLKKMEPWAEYGEWFNYYALNLRSNDKGVSREPGGIKKDTPCGGVVNGGTFTVDHEKARSWVDRFPGPSQAVCIGNDNASVATGGGGVVAVVKGMIDVTGHELGHAFGGLLDEYDFDPGGKPAPPAAPGPIPTEVLGANVIKGNQKDDLRAKAPWKHWIDMGSSNWTGKIVDIFEGAATVPKDHWRPQADCRMRTAASNFCCACMEQMILRLYETVRPIDEVDPKDEKLEITADEKLVLKATCLRPKPPRNPLDGKWEIRDVSASESPDGSTVVREEKAREIEGKSVDLEDGRHLYGTQIKNLKPGLYDITFTVSDPTVWVHEKYRGALKESRTWRVRVRANR